MGKFQIDAMLDDGLDYISANATELYLCTEQPVDRAAAIAASLIAAVIPGFGAIADGIVSGRRIPVNAVTDEPITATGDATHVVLCSATTLLYGTTCTQQTLTSGGTVTIPTWNVELRDPT
jgi:hypothetical protein